MATKFKRGDQVEISCNEPGFKNTYFPATIISQINNNNNNEYIVQFNTLLGKDKHDQSPLREFHSSNVLRPVPPVIEVKKYDVGEDVDAYAKGIWWKGTVVKTGCGGGRGSNWYHVRFDMGGHDLVIEKYLVSSLRVHQEWVDGEWVCSNKRDLA